MSELILPDYQALFDNMVILDSWKEQSISQAKKILAGNANYKLLCSKVNISMPWWFPGIIHSMECDCNFMLHLHNGDSLRARTVNEPKGRPVADPMNGKKAPYTWIESAIDAIQYDGFAPDQQWTLPLILQRFEKYNGFGYLEHGINSPYLWSGTNQYTKGKFSSDGHFDAEEVSEEVGCAVLFKYLTDHTLELV
jgi:lysozyme family protein